MSYLVDPVVLCLTTWLHFVTFTFIFTKNPTRGNWKTSLIFTLQCHVNQSRARLFQDSRSRTFWCSSYLLDWQDNNWKCLVSFPFSRYSFVKSRSCLVYKQSTLKSITHLDILEQILVNKCNFYVSKNLKFISVFIHV